MDLHNRVLSLMIEASETLIMPRWRQLEDEHVSTKSGPMDLVTVADIETEDWLTPRLRDLLPGSQVLGEEAKSRGHVELDITRSDDPLWVIDPVDGTRAFANGSENFCSMVGLVRGGHTVAAWIYYPVSKSLVTAELGGGTYECEYRVCHILKTSQHLHGAEDGSHTGLKGHISARALDPNLSGDLQQLQVRSMEDLETIQGHVSLRYFPQDKQAKLKARMAAHPLPQPHPMQAAGLEYRDLARGVIDFAVFYSLMPWDHVPGALILSEAGGIARSFAGHPYSARMHSGGMIAAANEDVAERVKHRWEL